MRPHEPICFTENPSDINKPHNVFFEKNRTCGLSGEFGIYADYYGIIDAVFYQQIDKITYRSFCSCHRSYNINNDCYFPILHIVLGILVFQCYRISWPSISRYFLSYQNQIHSDFWDDFCNWSNQYTQDFL